MAKAAYAHSFRRAGTGSGSPSVSSSLSYAALVKQPPPLPCTTLLTGRITAETVRDGNTSP